MGPAERLLSSVGVFESASCVLDSNVADPAHAICLAKQLSLAGYISNTDGLSFEV